MVKSMETSAPQTELMKLSTGAEIAVWKMSPENPSELIVFLHAVGGDHKSWAPQMRYFSSDYACVSLDFRGHGKSAIKSSDGPRVGIDYFAEDVIALIQSLNFAKAHLVGLSMGGVVALEVFSQRPDLVQSITMANAWAHHAEAAGRIKFMEDQLAAKPLMQSSKELLPGLFASTTANSIIEQTIETEGTKDKDVFLDSWRSMFLVDFRTLLETIDVPLLLIGGTVDNITPTQPLLTDIKSKVHMAQLVNIEGANHFSNLDKPEEFNRALKIHLNRGRSLHGESLAAPVFKEKTFEADTVAHTLMKMLDERHVDCFFSNSGTDFTPIIDALARYHNDTKMKTIVAPHENTAIAMAHGHFLLSGKPQVVMAHVNVGTANMGLGIINASRSRVPMLVLAGKTPWYESDVDGCRTNFVQWGQDTFDQGAYFREFTKWDYELKGGFNLETIVDRAFAVAGTNPAGPVYLTLPKESLCQKVDGLKLSDPARQIASKPSRPNEQALEVAARILLEAKNPLVVTAEAGRYRGAPEALVRFAQQHAIPVIEHGKRNFFNFPTIHPMHLGFNPSPYVEQADVIVAVESHVPWIPALSKVKKAPLMIQIGVDPLCQNIPMRSFPVDVSIAGDPAQSLKELTRKLTDIMSEAIDYDKRRKAIKERYTKWHAEHTRLYEDYFAQAGKDADKKAITKRYLSMCIGQAIDDDVVIFNEYDLDPFLVPRELADSWFENSVASGLGWSLGAALGGQLASPERTMVVTVGDGSYLFNTPLSAHYAAAAYELPILIIVFNDTAWTTIKKSYLGTTPDGWGKRTGVMPLCDFDLTVKFEKLAESCGGIGLTVERPSELLDVLKKSIAIVRNEKKHVLLNVICERDA